MTWQVCKNKYPLYNGRAYTFAQLPSLGRKEREINLKNAFKTSTNALELKKVLLVDDIYTTGVTMDEAAKVLWMAGAEEVHFLVLCTGKPDC